MHDIYGILLSRLDGRLVRLFVISKPPGCHGNSVTDTEIVFYWCKPKRYNIVVSSFAQ